MKMKAVCEATGLTDRTIRYYIDEELISPAYTENYLGRKTFDFSEGDIQQLKDIAVLRKFGFSIAEIRKMMLQPECIVQISKELQARKQAAISEESTMLAALTRLDTLRQYTVSELAAVLSKPVCEAPLPVEDSSANPLRSALLFIKIAAVFLITWLPVALGAKAVFDYYHSYQYPIINFRGLVIIAILVLPTALILLVPKFIIKPLPKRIVKSILLILCIIITPINYFLTCFAFSVSETSNHHNYRLLDANCPAGRDEFFQDLFPAWPEYSDTKYYYYYSEGVFGNTCDIYSEWSLDENEFQTEIFRVHALYEACASDNGINQITLQKGKYTCFVLYSGSPPFEAATEDYAYYIFGYDEQNMKVRYIYCDSQVNGADQPYYLTLDWE